MPTSEEIAKLAPLGIIAGGGALPESVLYAAQNQGREVYVAALKGSADDDFLDGIDHDFYCLGAGGSIVKALRKRNIKDIVMIGSVSRPHFSDLRPDMWTAGVMAKIGLKALGDNDLLVCIKDALEAEGFALRGAHEIAPELITPEGLLTKHKPDKKALIDIERGIAVARALGVADVGQSVIVYDGLVLGVEGVEGTDELIKRCAGYRKKDKGGILVKLCKQQQDKRLDMPTIGIKTLQNLYDNGFEGIAIHAGQSLIPERAAFIDTANNRKLFVVGVDGAQVT
jgi:DUF1009 family protein